MRIIPLATAFCLICAPAMAAQINYTPVQPGSPEAEVASSVVALAEDTEISLVDLDADGKGEIFLRFPSECDETDTLSCRVVTLMFAGGNWENVFDRKVKMLETADGATLGVTGLVADQLYWNWGPAERYTLDTGASGQAVSLSPAPADYVELLAYQFGEGALNLFRKQTQTEVRIGSATLGGPETSQVIARLQGPGVCGIVMGCPVRVLSIVDGKYVTLLEGSGVGEIAVLPVNRAGWSDVVTNLPDGGFAVYGWDGERYGVIEVVPGEKP